MSDYSSGAVTVNGVISAVSALALPSASQTIKNIVVQGTGSVITAYTVPAGKTFYLYAVNAINGHGGSIYQDDGTTKVYNMQELGGMQSCPVPIWVYTTGKAVKFTGSNAQTYIFIGVEI